MYRGQWLGLVIRQWVEEKPNVWLARTLERDPTWRRLVAEPAEMYGLLQQRHGGTLAIEDWLSGRAWQRAGIPKMDEATAVVLAANSLPSTPTTVRCLRALSAGIQSIRPTRGILVTRLAYVDTRTSHGGTATGDHDADNQMQFTVQLSPRRSDGIDESLLKKFAPPHDTLYSGPTEMMTVPLWKRVRQVKNRYEAFLHSVHGYEVTTLRAVRQNQPGSMSHRARPPAANLDYVTELIDEATRVQLSDPSGEQWAKLCRKVDHRIRKRLARAGLPVTPPHAWRDTAAEAIRSRLKIPR